MRVDVVNLGNGLHRLDVTPSYCEGVTPQCVMDNIMRDVVRRENTVRPIVGWTTTVTRPCIPNRPVCPPRPTREPDGIDAHIDRPKRSNYGGIPWIAEDAYQRDLAKYRNAERAIKSCNWPAREPMKGTEHLPQPMPQTKFVGVATPRPTVSQFGMISTPCPCVCDAFVDDEWDDDWF